MHRVERLVSKLLPPARQARASGMVRATCYLDNLYEEYGAWRQSNSTGQRHTQQTSRRDKRRDNVGHHVRGRSGLGCRTPGDRRCETAMGVATLLRHGWTGLHPVPPNCACGAAIPCDRGSQHWAIVDPELNMIAMKAVGWGVDAYRGAAKDSGGAGERVQAGGGLEERGDHVPDGRAPASRPYPVPAERDAAVRRGPVLERVEQGTRTGSAPRRARGRLTLEHGLLSGSGSDVDPPPISYPLHTT